MLILHSSSRCDVCLDAYTWQTIAQTPHAIPCGHVFCRPCLLTLSPQICPLCRKKFEPNKAKKLHVDRPENVDEIRENDLLQRLSVSWDAPEDQLRELMYEVDTWLDSRADDTCIVLRKARAALTRHIELKKTEMTLENTLADIHAMEIAYNIEQRNAAILKEDKIALIRENEGLKAEVKELRTASEQHSSWKNPLPLPPEPIPTEYVPTFAQAMALERGVRFDLPQSGTGSPYPQSFEVEPGRKRRKGKAKSLDHRIISPTNQNPHPLPTQLAKMDPSEESPALISHFDHHHSPRQRHQAPTPAPASGLQLHFENTNQPLDAFELTHTYLREYSQGLLDGQRMAGQSSFRQASARINHSRTNVSLSDNNESIESRSIRSNHSTQNRENQSAFGPSTVDRSSRPHHRRETSLATSTESSSTGQHNQNRSRSRSRSSLNHISNPSLVALLSNGAPSAPPTRPMPSIRTSPLIHSPNPSIPSLSLPTHEQQLEPLIQPNLGRTNSPAPSQRSKASSWGTIISTSTNLTTYSLLGLRDFRDTGSYARMSVGSEGVSTWSSPTRRVSTMVGVIPAHEAGGGSRPTSPHSRDRNGSRTNPHRLPRYPSSPSPPSVTSWHGSAPSLSPTPDQPSSSNGYHSDDENIVRPDEYLNSSYSRDFTGNRSRPVESRIPMRGRNQPLPAVSPSFLFGDAIISEEDDRSDQNVIETFGFGNALGLQLSTGPTPISAPTPVVPHRSFLRSFSDVHETE